MMHKSHRDSGGGHNAFDGATASAEGKRACSAFPWPCADEFDECASCMAFEYD
jgi:hypothetical protein